MAKLSTEQLTNISEFVSRRPMVLPARCFWFIGQVKKKRFGLKYPNRAYVHNRWPTMYAGNSTRLCTRKLTNGFPGKSATLSTSV